MAATVSRGGIFGPQFKLTGTKELSAALKELGAAPAGALGEKAVRAGSEVIAKQAKQTSAFVDRTGDLRKSIDVNNRVDKTRTERTAYFGSHIFYGSFLEFGTRFIAPRSWLRDSMDEAAIAALQAMLDVLSKGVEDIANKHTRGFSAGSLALFTSGFEAGTGE